MADVDYELFLDANLEGYEEEKRIIVPIFTELKNLTIQNTNLRHTCSLLLSKLISGGVNVGTPIRIMEVSEA